MALALIISLKNPPIISIDNIILNEAQHFTYLSVISNDVTVGKDIDSCLGKVSNSFG